MLFSSASSYHIFSMEPTNLSLTGAIITPKFLGAVLWKAVSNFDLLCPFSGYSHFYISIKDVCHFHLASLMPQQKVGKLGEETLHFALVERSLLRMRSQGADFSSG